MIWRESALVTGGRVVLAGPLQGVQQAVCWCLQAQRQPDLNCDHVEIDLLTARRLACPGGPSVQAGWTFLSKAPDMELAD